MTKIPPSDTTQRQKQKKDQKNRELGDRESNPDIRRDRTEY